MARIGKRPSPPMTEEDMTLKDGHRAEKQPRTPSMFMRHVRMGVLLLLGYLVQTCVMPYVSVGGMTPSVLFPIIAVITVGFGKVRAFWAGAFYGIVLETMHPTVPLLNLMLYPAAALLWSVVFSDKSPQQLEYERSLGRAGRNVSPLVRTPLCTLLLALSYDGLNLIYIYLRGTDLTAAAIGRGLLDTLVTTLLSVVLTVPLRRFLGFRPERRRVTKPTRYEPYAPREPQP